VLDGGAEKRENDEWRWCVERRVENRAKLCFPKRFPPASGGPEGEEGKAERMRRRSRRPRRLASQVSDEETCLPRNFPVTLSNDRLD